jgi:hypothetical protein
MTASRLARWLGLDGNPLRRRTDKIAAGPASLLVAVFLAGAPVLSMVAARWAFRATNAEQQAARSWRQVPAVLQRATPVPAAWELFGHSWVQARWTAPDGRARAGEIPVSGGLAAGRAVPLWVDLAGSPTGHHAMVIRKAAAPFVTTAVLAVVLPCLACAGRWVVHRRRLAGWERHGPLSGPKWTKRFPVSRLTFRLLVLPIISTESRGFQ